MSNQPTNTLPPPLHIPDSTAATQIVTAVQTHFIFIVHLRDMHEGDGESKRGEKVRVREKKRRKERIKLVEFTLFQII